MMESWMRKSMVGLLMVLVHVRERGGRCTGFMGYERELGFVAARGNTRRKPAMPRFRSCARSTAGSTRSRRSGLYGKSQGITSAQHFDGRLQVDRSFGEQERWFWFGALRYEDDRFSGFDYQTTVTTGSGHKFIDTRRDETHRADRRGLSRVCVPN